MAKIINKSSKKGAQLLEAAVVERAKPKLEAKLERPAMFRVVMLNDDYTPMDFVVVVLEVFFGLASEKAIQIMLDVHQRGRGVCGVFTQDIAQTKVVQVGEFSRSNGHPLMCKIEKI